MHNGSDSRIILKFGEEESQTQHLHNGKQLYVFILGKLKEIKSKQRWWVVERGGLESLQLQFIIQKGELSKGHKLDRFHCWAHDARGEKSLLQWIFSRPPFALRNVLLLIWNFRWITGNGGEYKHLFKGVYSHYIQYILFIPKANVYSSVRLLHYSLLSFWVHQYARQETTILFVSAVSHPEPTVICHITLRPVTAWGDTPHCTED